MDILGNFLPMICAIIVSTCNEQVLVRSLSTLVEGITHGVLRRVVVIGDESVKELTVESGCDFVSITEKDIQSQLPAHNEKWIVMSDQFGLEPGWAHELESKLLQLGTSDMLRFPRSRLKIFSSLARLFGLYETGPALVVNEFKDGLIHSKFVSVPPYRRVAAMERKCFTLAPR